MRVVVIGGNGFVGAQALHHLVDEEHDILCFDIQKPSPIAAEVQDEVTFAQGDVTDPAQVYDAASAFNPDGIIDFASLLGRESQQAPRQAVSTNLQGSLNVLQAAATLDVDRVVTAASVAVYGSSSGDTLTENTARTPNNVYGMTKYALEEIGVKYEDRGIEFAAMEPVHGLGPDRRRGNIEDAVVCKAAVSGIPLTVPNVEQPLEIVHVGEEARAFVDALKVDELNYNRYIVGTEKQTTLAEIVEIVQEHVPDADFEFNEKRSDDQLEHLPPSDTSRIKQDIGWEATYSVEETVKAYLDWLRNNPMKWSFEPSDIPWKS